MLPALIAVAVVVLLALLRSLLRIGEHLVEDEIKARLPHAAAKTLDRAIEALPPELRAARHEEWMAELCSLQGQRLRSLWFARQCLRAAVAEAVEWRAAVSTADGRQVDVTVDVAGPSRRARALVRHARRALATRLRRIAGVRFRRRRDGDGLLVPLVAPYLRAVVHEVREAVASILSELFSLVGLLRVVVASFQRSVRERLDRPSWLLDRTAVVAVIASTVVALLFGILDLSSR